VNAVAAFDVFRLHGGKVQAARSLFPQVREPWIDLSTGISPWCYPHDAIAAEAFTRLPDPEALAELEAAAAHSFGVEDAAGVIATPGSDLALRVLGRVLGPTFSGRVAVVRPGYSGHMLMWDGARVTSIRAKDLEAAAREHDVIVLANPNNPDGAVISRERLLAVAELLAERDGVLIVDEAFADVKDEHSLCGSLGGSHAGAVIVLRSFGKFFGLAGVRLGFVVTACSGGARAFRAQERSNGLERSHSGVGTSAAVGQEVRASHASVLRHAFGDWPVSGIAVALGTAAYRDLAWQASQRRRITSAAERLDALLTRAGLTIVGGTALYRLARSPNADALFKHLASRGILTRPFSSDPTLLRVGLPAYESDWQRFADALDSRAIS
jgi:cobalamin biosynthetic protein CobC